MQQTGANIYTQGFGSRPENVEIPVISKVAPTSSNFNYPLGKRWINTATNSSYVLTSVSTVGGVSTATWSASGGANVLETLTGDTGTATASNGNIKIAGTAAEITTAASGSTVTLSLPSAITAPGSLTTTTTLASGTTITAGTGLTVTTGNATVSSGNVVVSASGDGLVLPVATGSGAASGAVTCNGRVGSVAFTSPSIAGGAVETLTVTNSAITGSGTYVLYSVRGATTGAALCIQSVTNSAGSSAVVINNGTGATTQAGTITLDFIVLN